MNKEKLILALWIWTEMVVFLCFFDFRSTGVCIRSTDLVIFDLLVSQWIYDLIFICPLTLHLYLWLLLSLLLLEWDRSFFNYLAPGFAGKTATLQSPAAPGESIPCWDHPLLAWVGDERNSRDKKMGDEWRKRTIWGWETLTEATHVEQFLFYENKVAKL